MRGLFSLRATACPAHCIDIVGVQSPWPGPRKISRKLFDRDVVAAGIFCGMCEEGLPGRRDRVDQPSGPDLGRSREEMIFDKEKLLSVYDQTKDAEPMKSAASGGTV